MGTFTRVEATQVDDRIFEIDDAEPEAVKKSADREAMPGHLKGLYETAKGTFCGWKRPGS